MQSFKTAKFVLALLMVIGWSIITISIVFFSFAAVGIFSNDSNIALMPMLGASLASAVFGLVNVAIAQMGLAQIATAENTGQILLQLQSQQQERFGGIE
jgi:hypothetical protein